MINENSTYFKYDDTAGLFVSDKTKDLEKLYLFPTFVGVFDIEDHENLNNEIKNKFNVNENENGSRSRKNLWDQREHVGAVNRLYNIVRNNCAKYVNSFFNLELNSEDFEMKKAWLNVHHPYYPVHFHNHRQTAIAFVYYVDVVENSGGLQFLDPRSGLGWVHPDQMKQFNLFNFRPSNGKMILFPGWMIHSIAVNKSDQNRIAIAGNVHLREDLYEY